MIAPDSDSPSIDAPSSPNLEATNPPLGKGRLLGLALLAGLIAGGTAWLAGEAILVAYQSVLSPKIKREVNADAVHQYASALLTSASGTYAALGAILGLSLGLTGGLIRRSVSAGIRAALLGFVVGSMAGASTSLLILPHFFKTHDPQSQDMVLPLLTLGSICSAVGATGGLSFGIGLGGRDRWVKSLVGGLIGAALATVVYEVAGGIGFPGSQTELPVSNRHVTRAMLHVMVAVVTAVGASLALGLSSKRHNPASPGS